MKKILSLAMIALFCATLSAQTKQNIRQERYTKAWSKVSLFEEKSLPRSASEEVNKILKMAIRDKNSPQVIKAIIHLGKYDVEIDRTNDTLITHTLKTILATSGDKIEKAIICSMLGELYLRSTRDQYDIAIEMLNNSLQEQSLLENTPITNYDAIVGLGKDSRRFYPSVYDFLSLRAIEMFAQIADETNSNTGLLIKRKNISMGQLFSPSQEFIKLQFTPKSREYGLWVFETYRKLLSSLQSRNMKHAILLTEIKKLEYLSLFSTEYSKYAMPALQHLLKLWENDEFSVEIIAKIDDFYENKIFGYEEKRYELLSKAIDQYPKYQRISVLRNKLSTLIQPEFTISGEKTYPLHSRKILKISYKNLKSIKIKLYKHIALSESNKYAEYDRREKLFVKDFIVSLPSEEPYSFGQTEFTIPIEEYGSYSIETDSEQIYNFAISDLMTFGRSYKENSCEFFVVNRESGKPETGAEIRIFEISEDWQKRKIKLITSIPTDKLGRAEYSIGENKNQHNFVYQAVCGNDIGALYSTMPGLYYKYSSGDEENNFETVNIYTDRSIYRPGQVVYFKAIASKCNASSNISTVIKGRSYKAILYDVNYQQLSEVNLKTDEFGSMNGQFILPKSTLSGNFSIQIEDNRSYIKVEEYKAPTFEITFDTIDKTYKFGEKITLNGHVANFSGVKLQNMEVKYRIVRSLSWWLNGDSSLEQIDNGDIKTDINGSFQIEFTPEKGGGTYPQYRSIYSFMVEVSVTDLNGETQSAKHTISVGDVSMILVIDIPTQLEKSSSKNISFIAQNLDGSIISTKGEYTLFSLDERDSVVAQIIKKDFSTGDQIELREKLKSLSSGKYRLKLSANDDNGNPIETEKEFILFSYSDKTPPIKTNEWFVLKSDTFDENSPAEIILGVSDSSVHVLYEIWQNNTIIKQSWITIKNQNRLFSLPYQKEYKEEITLLFTYVKNEKFYSHRAVVQYKKKSSDLTMKWEVFRDKIRPGSYEEWRISIKNQDGNPVNAELLASAYDLSLDQICPAERWILRKPYRRTYSVTPHIYPDNSTAQESIGWYDPKLGLIDNKYFEFDKFKWYGLEMYSHQTLGWHDTRAMLSENRVMYRADKVKSNNLELEEELLSGTEIHTVEEPPIANDNTKITIRKNFNETAFFYPKLRTNSKGEAQISFTVPDINTRWKVRVLAHDQHLNSGNIETITTSSKELIITPNMPRFLRAGDTTVISTKISNLSDRTLDGEVKMEFFDPTTDEIINTVSIDNDCQKFSINRDASSEASWKFLVPDSIDLIGCRIVANNNHFSDGEQRALTILSDRILVTESMPITLPGKGSKEYNLKRLTDQQSKTISNYRLSLEFASNPAWYAVQALPIIAIPDNDNAISWFASYYANTLGYHISKIYPKISLMISAWKDGGGDKNSFLSNLQKNEELKTVIAEETPWILEAKTESDQKAKLSLLFDINHSKTLTSQACNKLMELQCENGGWSWFKGFYPSRSITLYILYGLNQLSEFKVDNDQDIEKMRSSAIAFIDNDALQEFEEMKRRDKEWKRSKYISNYQLEYIYVRSAYSQYPISKDVQSMIDFYTSIAEKNWTNFNMYQRSLIAVLMQTKGKKNITEDILKSYREHATINSDMGMFWANNSANVFMSQSAISIHTFIMDAFNKAGVTTTEMDKMKLWLLKQKQTQIWESTHATMDAIYTLLSTGNDWFSAQEATTVTLGNIVIKPEQREIGTGYFKETWSRDEIKPEMGLLSIKNSENTPVWGALYLQYFEQLDKITKGELGHLNIEKSMFIETIDYTGKRLTPVTDSTTLHIGDKIIVRLTVKSDRDMEFIHIKDMRASCMESEDQTSKTEWRGNSIYYKTIKDASINFYIDNLLRGSHTFEYELFVTRYGDYSSGIATIQCMYAPEFTHHTEGQRIRIVPNSHLSK